MPIAIVKKNYFLLTDIWFYVAESAYFRCKVNLERCNCEKVCQDRDNYWKLDFGKRLIISYMVSNCILWQKSLFFLPKMQFTIIKSMITSSKDSLDSIILYFELHLEKAKGDRNIVIIIFFLFSLFFVIHFRVVLQYFLCSIKYRTILYRK